MKKFLLALTVLILSISSVFAAGSKEDAALAAAAADRTLTVYSYDTFASDWGPGPKVIADFEEKTGIKVDLVTGGDAIETFNQIMLEGKDCKADVFLGASDDMAWKVLEADILDSYDSPALADIPAALQFDPSNRLLPFDYGVFAFIIDSEAGVEAPEHLMDLTKPEWKDKTILIDPRTSSVGLGLLLWTHDVLGENYLEWWSAMKDNMLVMTEGWSSAYTGAFMEGEAPLCISYTTSPIYHVLNEDTTRYQTVVFPEGHHGTIEGVGIMKGTKHRAEAEEFVDYLLTEAQLYSAIGNSMYPVNSAIELDPVYDYAPVPETVYTCDQDFVKSELNNMIRDWVEVMTK